VEFAIISMVMVMVCIGLIDFGRGLNIRNQLSLAADYGARYILTDSKITDGALETAVRNNFTAFEPDLLKITVEKETVNGLDFRTMTLAYPFTSLVPGVSIGQINLSVVRRTPTF